MPSYLRTIALAASLTAILIQSCTVEKRKHLPGYSVEWGSKKALKESETSLDDAVAKNSKESVGQQDSDDEITAYAAIHKEYYEDVKSTYKALAKVIAIGFSKDTCDILITQDGDEFRCKVIEIGVDVVKYRKCGFNDGPLISLPRSMVFMIRYSNGEKEIIKPISNSQKKEDEYESAKSPKKRLDVLGLVGFCLTIASILPWWFVSALIGFFAGIIGIVFGSISLARIVRRRDSRKGLGFAIVSLILGVLLIAATLIVWASIGVI